jgi:hypothetical protein
MYSKKIENFKKLDIRLLKSQNDILIEIEGYGIDSDYMDCDIEKGEIIQITKTPNEYHIGSFNDSGCGKSSYSFKDTSVLIENTHFEFL